MAKQNLGGVYANMDFPPYVWVEYPKHITIDSQGRFEIAKNLAEEEEILRKLQKTQDDAPAQFVPHVADPEKEILVSRAAELGVPINRLWSKLKISLAIKDFEEAADNLPADTEKKQASPEEGSPEEYKNKLINEAKSLGIKASHIMGTPRLEDEIAKAKQGK